MLFTLQPSTGSGTSSPENIAEQHTQHLRAKICDGSGLGEKARRGERRTKFCETGQNFEGTEQRRQLAWGGGQDARHGLRRLVDPFPPIRSMFASVPMRTHPRALRAISHFAPPRRDARSRSFPRQLTFSNVKLQTLIADPMTSPSCMEKTPLHHDANNICIRLGPYTIRIKDLDHDLHRHRHRMRTVGRRLPATRRSDLHGTGLQPHS